MSLDTQDGWCSGLGDNTCISKGGDKSATVISEMVARSWVPKKMVRTWAVTQDVLFLYPENPRLLLACRHLIKEHGVPGQSQCAGWLQPRLYAVRQEAV